MFPVALKINSFITLRFLHGLGGTCGQNEPSCQVITLGIVTEISSSNYKIKFEIGMI